MASRNEDYERNVSLLLQDIDTSDLFPVGEETEKSGASDTTTTKENYSNTTTSGTLTSVAASGNSSSSSEVGALSFMYIYHSQFVISMM